MDSHVIQTILSNPHGQSYRPEMDVPSPYDSRANQKNRTRAAIVDAAIALLAQGSRPTVPQAAAEAKVSRATAYRYFPTQESLLIEAAAIGPVDAIEKLLSEQSGADARGHLLELQSALNKLMVREENVMRMALRAYLDAWFAREDMFEDKPDIREGRRTRWISATLRHLLDDVPAERARRLRAGLALTMGIEPLVVMKDVCRMSDGEACETLQWVAETLLDAVLKSEKWSCNETNVSLRSCRT